SSASRTPPGKRHLTEVVRRLRDRQLRTMIGRVSTPGDAVVAFSPTGADQREHERPRSSEIVINRPVSFWPALTMPNSAACSIASVVSRPALARPTIFAFELCTCSKSEEKSDEFTETRTEPSTFPPLAGPERVAKA